MLAISSFVIILFRALIPNTSETKFKHVFVFLNKFIGHLFCFSREWEVPLREGRVEYLRCAAWGHRDVRVSSGDLVRGNPRAADVTPRCTVWVLQLSLLAINTKCVLQSTNGLCCSRHYWVFYKENSTENNALVDDWSTDFSLMFALSRKPLILKIVLIK